MHVPYQYYIAGHKEAKYDDIANVGMKGSKQPSHSDDSKPDEQVDHIYRKGKERNGKGSELDSKTNPNAIQLLLHCSSTNSFKQNSN